MIERVEDPKVPAPDETQKADGGCSCSCACSCAQADQATANASARRETLQGNQFVTGGG